MKVISNEYIICFDVDNTLVLWDVPKGRESETIWVGRGKHRRRVLPHWKHVEEIKKYKARGHHTVVWSQGGSAWAAAVVKVLGLEEFVDTVMRKPMWYYDDWKAEVFMGQPIFLENK